MRGLDFRQRRFQRQTRFRKRGVEIFHAVMTYRDHDHAGETFFFQAKLCVENGGIKAFDWHRVQAHRRNTQQEVTDVQVHLFRHPVVVIVEIFAVQVGKESTAFVVPG